MQMSFRMPGIACAITLPIMASPVEGSTFVMYGQCVLGKWRLTGPRVNGEGH